MSYGSLIVQVSPDTALIPADAQWIRLELVPSEDEKISGVDAATLTDTLYDIDPCIEVTGDIEEPEPPTEEDLKAAAKEVLYDLVKCEELLSGDYTRDVLVVRSHLDEQYVLRLTIGTIGQTTQIMERKEESIDVAGDTYVTLPFPVPPAEHFPDQSTVLAASWMGAVIGEDGQINPPAISRNGNTLFWGFPVTGTLMVHWDTIYDRVTVNIPGLGSETGLDFGLQQNSTLLAFYNNMVATTEITPPERPDEQDWEWLSWICGWEDNEAGGGQFADESPEDDEDEAPDPLRDGCMEHREWAADGPNFKYECCRNPPWTLIDCVQYRTKRNAKGLLQSVKDYYQNTADSGGAFGGLWIGGFQYNISNVVYVGHGPAPDDENGCGWNYWNLYIPDISCCDELETQLSWDAEESEVVVDRLGYITVAVNGGARPTLDIAVRGKGFWLDSRYTKRSMSVNKFSNHVEIHIFADEEACGHGEVSVSDGCTTVTGYIQSTEGEWISIEPEDCEYRRVAAQSASSPGLAVQKGSYAVFYFQDGKYKIQQQYWRGPEETGYSGFSGYSFEEACSRSDDIDWTSLIGEAQSDRHLDFSSFPELIDIDSCAERVTEYNSNWHGFYLDPIYGNSILFSGGAFGGEKMKKYNAGSLFNLRYQCVSAGAYSVDTGGTGISATSDGNTVYVWEWVCP